MVLSWRAETGASREEEGSEGPLRLRSGQLVASREAVGGHLALARKSNVTTGQASRAPTFDSDCLS